MTMVFNPLALPRVPNLRAKFSALLLSEANRIVRGAPKRPSRSLSYESFAARFCSSRISDPYEAERLDENSGWRFVMDTTKLSNARHRLTVRVLDTLGFRTEIGSVDFYVQNLSPTP